MSKGMEINYSKTEILCANVTTSVPMIWHKVASYLGIIGGFVYYIGFIGNIGALHPLLNF